MTKSYINSRTINHVVIYSSTVLYSFNQQLTNPAIVESYENLLHNGVYLIQIFSYTISFIIISISIITSTYIYFHKFNSQRDAYNETKLNLGRSIALALSFILGVEILKLFYIKTYQQLVVVATLVAIKLLVSYFLSKEINNDHSSNC